MTDKTFDLADQLRRAAKKAGYNTYTLWKLAGVDRGIASRFLRGERGLNLTTASKICALLGLTLQPARGHKARG